MKYSVLWTLHGRRHDAHVDDPLTAGIVARCISGQSPQITVEVWQGSVKLAEYKDGEIVAKK